MAEENKNRRFALSDDELEQVTGGLDWVSGDCPYCGTPYSIIIGGNDKCSFCGQSVLTWI